MRRNRITLLPAVLAVLALGAMALTGCTTSYYDDDPDIQDDYYAEDEGYDDGELVFDEFEDLEYWGQWFPLAPFGWVWRPTVVLEWRPYDHGHWIWTEYGWAWESYEPFGWITYHYGFWAHDVVWGWIWIPDYEWYPARAEWVTFDGFIAWAPIPPPRYDGWGDPWGHGYDVYAWHVVEGEHFGDTEVGRYHRQFKESYRVKERTSVRYKAPDVASIERTTRRTLRPVTIEMTELQVRGRTIQRMKLPKDERIVRLRETTTAKIRVPGEEYPDYQTKVPYQDDRIVPARERREPAKKPDTRERKKKPEVKKRKDDPGEPIKQEPNKKQREKKKPPEKKGKEEEKKPSKQERETPKKKKKKG
jgi:hypothetical protein